MALSDREIIKPGVKLTIKSGSLQKQVHEAVRRALPLVGDIYLRAALNNISLTDHDLQELRESGHPYAWGHEPVHEDDRMVHIQSGKLYESLNVTSVVEGDKNFAVYLQSDSPYIDDLIYGTRFMRPRRFHEKAYEDVKRILWLPLIAALGKVRVKITS